MGRNRSALYRRFTKVFGPDSERLHSTWLSRETFDALPRERQFKEVMSKTKAAIALIRELARRFRSSALRDSLKAELVRDYVRAFNTQLQGLEVMGRRQDGREHRRQVDAAKLSAAISEMLDQVYRNPIEDPDPDLRPAVTWARLTVRRLRKNPRPFSLHWYAREIVRYSSRLSTWRKRGGDPEVAINAAWVLGVTVTALYARLQSEHLIRAAMGARLGSRTAGQARATAGPLREHILTMAAGYRRNYPKMSGRSIARNVTRKLREEKKQADIEPPLLAALRAADVSERTIRRIIKK